MDKDVILILTGQYGDGHKQAAEALKFAFLEENKNVTAEILDITDFMNPLFDAISKQVFIRGIKRFPAIYNYIYQKTRGENMVSSLFKRINHVGLYNILPEINKFNPTMIVSTFPIASGMLSLLKDEKLIKARTTTVITDHTVHSSWIYPNTDHYVVGSEIVKQGLIDYGVHNDLISVTGIPIHPKFSLLMNTWELKDRHEIDHAHPTLLIMGGGFGILRDIHPMMKMLESFPKSVNLLIVCGHNQKLALKLHELLKDSRHHVHIYGYIDYVHELMAIADIMITKPGGMTISEAMAMELPMLIFNSIGGQEYDNTRFLLSSGTAMIAESCHDLISKLTSAFDRINSTLPEMQQHIRQFGEHKFAAKHAAQVILRVNAADRIPYSLQFA